MRWYLILLVIYSLNLAGCDALRDIIDVVGHPVPDANNHDPDWIDIGLRSNHVLIVPGIAGAISCDNVAFGFDIDASLEADLVKRIDRPQGVDPYARQALDTSVQIWDWTLELPGDFCELFDAPDENELTSRLYERPAIQRVARSLADALYFFRSPGGNDHRKITVMAGSGGALIVLLAAEDQRLRNLSPKIFERVVFVSAALSNERSLKRLDELTEDGVYNYFSYNDATLQGYLCDGGQQLQYRWPAAGRFGYRNDTENGQIVRAQLPWNPDFISLKNNGEHMHAYRKEFFMAHLRPLILAGDLTSAWRTTGPDSWPESYVDSSSPQASATAFDTEGIPSASDSADALVLIVPGHENFLETRQLENLIEDEPRLDVFVWDWTSLDEVDDTPEDQRLDDDIIAKTARALARDIGDWRDRNPGVDLHVAAISGGAVVASVACDVTGENAIQDSAINSMLFTSALVSTARPLDGIMRCIRGNLYNYYSGANDDLLGTRFDCSITSDANFIEQEHDSTMAGVEDAVKWPAAGRFGYRALKDVEAHGRIQQLGWTEGYKRNYFNSGRHKDELDDNFAAEFFLPIFKGEQLHADWDTEVRGDYVDKK